MFWGGGNHETTFKANEEKEKVGLLPVRNLSLEFCVLVLCGAGKVCLHSHQKVPLKGYLQQ